MKQSKRSQTALNNSKGRALNNKQTHIKPNAFLQNGDSELIDEETGYKIVSLGNDIYELKHCVRCGRWVPIEEFRHSHVYPDGRLPHCKACSHKRYRKPTEKSSGVRLISKDETKQAEYVSTIEEGVKGLTSEISRFKSMVKEMEQKKEQNRIDLDHLTEKQVEHVLMVTKVSPRILFNSLATHYSQFSFFVIDKSTGEVRQIKTEVA